MIVDEVVHALRNADFPATKDELIQAARTAGASDEVVRALRAIPPGLDKFVRRVAQRAGATPEEAEAGVRAVFGVLRLAVTTGEFRDAMSQLPKEFSELVKQP